MAILLVTTLFNWTALPLQAVEKASAGKIDFRRDVRPILSDNCFACHGPDAAHVEADLRLDLRESAVRSDGVIILGKPAKSELVRRINSTDADERMPPEESHKMLSAAEKAILARWIAEGAEYDEHWSFIAPQSPEAPVIVDA
jgi:mono/diheme cytochrome c family protein